MTNSSVRGRLDVVPLLELMGAIARARKSGKIGLYSSQQSMSLTIERGVVRAVSTDDQSLRIGQVLIRLGLVTEEQIEQALALQSIASDPERVGEVLVDVSYISEDDICRAITVQMRTALNVMLDDSNRYFEFHPEVTEGEPDQCTDVTREPLVQTSTDLASSWLARFTERGDLIEVTAASIPPDPDAIGELSDDEQALVSRLLHIHRQLNVLIALRNRHARRVKRSVEWLLKHVLVQIETKQASQEQPMAIAKLVDRSNDLWTLSGLSSDACQVLLRMLNGEQRLSELREVTESDVEDTDCALHELVSAGLIKLEPAAPERERQTVGVGGGQEAPKSLIERLMP
jgi:hypothetical protein